MQPGVLAKDASHLEKSREVSQQCKCVLICSSWSRKITSMENIFDCIKEENTA